MNYHGGEMFIEVSSNLKKLSKFFPENLYVVGGYVRNKLLGIRNSDIDIASSVEVQEVINRLKDTEYKVKTKNLKLGSVLISINKEEYEYTTFRKEVYGQDGSHCPVVVEYTDKIEEDAIRRDFTVNSIYYNINKDEVVDLHHGIIDLKQKLIRCNIEPERILKNDGERILRMVRFAGELNFKIDKKILKTALKYVENIRDISGSRKISEIEKILNCDKRYNSSVSSLKHALKLLNHLGVWKHFGLKEKKMKYKMVYKVEDRFLGLLIDIVNMENPVCLQTFLESFLKEQFSYNQSSIKKIVVLLSGYYDALNGLKNKEYFFKYYQDWAYIYQLLGSKSKRIQGKYNFFYQYIIKHGLTISVSGLKIGEQDIKENFPNIDKRNYSKILNNLLSKVFDGKIKNDKQSLLSEIEKKLQNY